MEVIVSDVPTAANPFDPDSIAVDLDVRSPSGKRVQVPGFFYRGIFEVKPDYWGGNNFWPRHPYNAVNGGPCQTQNDFFTNEAARELYRKRLRYLVAHWSAYPNLLAWEFFNEIDNEYKYVKHEDVMAWHGQMGRHLRTLDPVNHLITSSFTGCSQRAGLYDLPEMDFAQYHAARLYQHWAALAAFLDGTGMGRGDSHLARFATSPDDAPLAFGVAARDEALVWLLDRAYDWPNGALAEQPRPKSGARAILLDVADGTWAVQWWDTLAGKCVADTEVVAANGQLALEPPPFQADIAARLQRK